MATGYWTNSPPENDGIYWFSRTGEPRFATPEAFNRTNDSVMRFTHRHSSRESGGGQFYPADHYPGGLWFSEPLVPPPLP